MNGKDRFILPNGIKVLRACERSLSGKRKGSGKKKGTAEDQRSGAADVP